MSHSLEFRAYRDGQHCLLRAWNAAHQSHDDASDASSRAYAGPDPLAEVRALARPLWPDAVDASDGGGSLADIAARTTVLIAQGCPRIREAVVVGHGQRVRLDVLERTPRGRWIAVLIRNGTRVSWALADRAAFTLHTLRGAGLDVAAIHALLLDESYVRPDLGPVDPHALFVRRSVSFPARRRLARLAAASSRVQTTIAASAPPIQAPGAHCRDDRDGCPYLEVCTATLPADWTGWLPRKDRPPLREWIAQGLVRMADLPDDRMLPRGVQHARRASQAGGAYVSPDLAAALAPAGPPAAYLDFECVATAVPVYPGTRPYAVVPFLWSLHEDDGAGGLTHRDDLAPAEVSAAPLRRMAEGLIDALGGSTTPIVVYSGYERDRLRDLAAALPDLAAPLEAIQARLVDLLEVVREHVYDLRFFGSFSIKAVAPALAPALRYDDLPIRDGLAAAQAYERVLRGHVPAVEAAAITADLRAYCARDTMAMVQLHRALRTLTANA